MGKLNLACSKIRLKEQWLIKALSDKGKKLVSMSNEDCEELEMNAMSTICLCLIPEVKYNVLKEISTPGLWNKL